MSRHKDSNGTTHFTRCSCGLLNNERLPGDHTYYYLLDGLGSIVGVTDSSGNKVNSYDYDPFGVMLNQQEGVANPFKFAGGYLDASGFEQFGVRYYSPSLGRWTQQDPVAGSLFDLNSGNRYIYASDDPVNVVDPTGKISQACFGAIAAAFLGSVGIGQAAFWLNGLAWEFLGSLVGGIDLAAAGVAGALLFSAVAILGLFISAALLAIAIAGIISTFQLLEKSGVCP